MTVIGWHGEDGGGTREMRRVVVGRLLDPEHPMKSMLEAAQMVYTSTGNRAEVVRLTDAEWLIVKTSEEVRAASRFCFSEERPAHEVVSSVTGLTIEVGPAAWQR